MKCNVTYTLNFVAHNQKQEQILSILTGSRYSCETSAVGMVSVNRLCMFDKQPGTSHRKEEFPRTEDPHSLLLYARLIGFISKSIWLIIFF